MRDKPVIKLTLQQRQRLLELMNYSYAIPAEYRKCVSAAIKKHATKQLSDETVQRMAEKSQSIADCGPLLRKDSFSLHRGKFAEWLTCAEYNALKNSGSVIMTIVNPDDSSKADLLHIIKVGDEFKAVPGPDIKSGGSTYVFEQWRKIVTSRYDIPMVDFDGVLTTEEGLKQLTRKQRETFERLCEQYPKKRPIPSAWSKIDESRLLTDYYKNILNLDGDFKYSPEIAEQLKSALNSQKNCVLPQSNWSEFNKNSKEILNGLDPIQSIEENEAQSREDTFQTNDNTTKDTPKPKFQFNFKKIPWSTVAKVGAAVVVTAAAGYVATNPVARQAVLNVAKNVVSKISGSAASAAASTATRNAASAAASAVNAATNTAAAAKDALGGTHASPILHEVAGYVRKNGTVVASYMRGVVK